MKQHPIFRNLYIFYSLVFLLHIINVFIESESLNYIIGLLAILMLIVSLIDASKLFKILGSAFLLIGGLVYFISGQSFVEIPEVLTSNMSLLTLLAMLPWMNSVVRSGRFDRSLNNLIRVNVSDLGKLYPRSAFITLTLASFLNLSAATISQDVLKDNLAALSKNLRNSFISTATLRGYSLALLWSPLEILVALSIFATGVDYVSLLPWMILISGVTLVLDSIWGRIHYGKYSYYDVNMNKRQPINVKAMTKKIVHFAIALIFFLILVIVIGNLFNWSFTLTVTLLIFPFAFIWSNLMKRRISFWVIGWSTWKVKTNTMQNFVVLFISLSLFSSSLNNTVFLEIIQKPLLFISEYPLIILFLIQVIFVFFSMFGIHPIATVGILTGITTPLLEIMNPISIAIVLITGSVATFTVGTYGLLVSLTSMSTGQSPYRITLNNMPFALVLTVIGTFVAYFLL